MGKRLFVRNAVAAHLLLVSMPALSSGQTFTNLASFSGGAGCGPLSVSLVQDINGDLYGTAEGGGNSGKIPTTAMAVAARFSESPPKTQLDQLTSLASQGRVLILESGSA